MTFSLFDPAFLGAVGAPTGFNFLDPANIGQPVEGGFFAGLISHTADGNPTHALIVAPRETGATGAGYTLTTSPQWRIDGGTTPGATSLFNGAANTAAIIAAGIDAHPAAKFCVDLSIGGFTDWYLPARFELDIAYFLLKPTTTSNNTSWGINDYSVPKRTVNYTTGNPAQTSIASFQSSQPEAFSAVTHWSSQESITNAWNLNFSNGLQNAATKTLANRSVRAFRRIAL